MSAQAALCATLVDEWVRHGVGHAVVAPGSRSTPMALALAARSELQLHVVLDERSAAFTALGIGRATGRPAVLLCTSGTATVHFHAAVVEAGLSAVPLLVCTADRPPELHRVGAPQAVDQVGLYGSAPVWSEDVDPAGWPPSAWRSLGSRAALEAEGGPVHLNLRLREPLLDDGLDPVPAARPGGRPWHERLREIDVTARYDAAGLGLAGRRRVLVVAGDGCDPRAADAAAGGRWPVLADPLSGWRVPGQATVAAFDAIARSVPCDGPLAPDLVLHVGRQPASKALGQWLDRVDAVHVLVDHAGRWLDPSRRADAAVAAPPDRVLQALQDALPAADPGWLRAWQHAEAVAQSAITEVLGAHPEVTEPRLARDLVHHLPHGAALVVSSSMPIRDVEWFAEPRSRVEVHANRGANGIDGVTSTALGVALTRPGRPTVALLGDLALLHDASALTGLAERGCPLTLIVVDNHGGGIFSFLPQAAKLPADRFEQLFGTPQPVDLLALAAAHGITAVEVERAAELEGALAGAVSSGGVRMLLARTDRRRNVEVHAELADAVQERLAGRG
jgi:2-succinyl-5-enolpyruvyl-6-hydroxy-3-cyclohexene-1-carboxylate synthase